MDIAQFAGFAVAYIFAIVLAVGIAASRNRKEGDKEHE